MYHKVTLQLTTKMTSTGIGNQIITQRREPIVLQPEAAVRAVSSHGHTTGSRRVTSLDAWRKETLHPVVFPSRELLMEIQRDPLWSTGVN